MSGIGLLSPNATGSIPAPATLVAVASAALASPTLCGWGAISFLSYPSLSGLAFSNGIDFQFHTVDAVTYLTGPRATRTAPTLLPSGSTYATRVLTGTGNFSDGETITAGHGASSFEMVSALDLIPSSAQVKIGSDLEESLERIAAMINDTGGEGSTYKYIGNEYGALYSVEVSAQDATTITFRSLLTGAAGNAAVSTETCANASFPGATFTGGADPTGTQPTAGTRRWAVAHHRKADAALTAISEYTELDTTADANVTVSAWDTFVARDATDLYRIYRTTEDTSIFLKLDDDTASPYTDDSSDDDLLAPLNYKYDPAIFRPYSSGYPQRYTSHCLHDGAIVGTGAIKSSKQTGTGTVTAGAYTVALTSFRLTTAAIGRNLRFTADSKKYLIVDISGSTVTLSEAYPVAMSGEACEVTDDRNPFEMLWNVPFLINQWPPARSLIGTYSNDSRGNTGIVSAFDGLVLWTMTGVTRAFGSPSQGYRFAQQIDGYGAYCQGAVVKAGLLYWLGPDGIFDWAGNGDPASLSEPRGGDPRGIAGTLARINPNAAPGIVSNYNPSTSVIRWWVPVDGSIFNNLVIVYDLKTGAFTFENCDGVSCATNVIAADGTYATLVGDIFGNIWQLDNGYADGAYGFECKQAVASYASGTNTITVSGTPFPTANGGLAGTPVYHLPAANGTPQRLTIASNTSSTLVLSGPPTTAPATGETIMVGALVMLLESTWFTMGAPDIRKTVSSITAQFLPTAATGTGSPGVPQMWCAVGYDGVEPTVHTNLDDTTDFADMTALKGTKFYDLRKGPGRRLKIVFLCFAPGFDAALVGFAMTVRMRGEVRR